MTESVSQNIYSGAKTLTRYKYDHEGNRVVKSSNYGEVVTPTPEISYRNDSIVTKHIFVSGVRVASKVCDEKSSNTYYQSVDHLGSTNVLTDDKGEFYEHIETFPDGSIWVKEYVDQSGVNATYTNYEMDVETKLFYAWARYYDAQLGKFISTDPAMQHTNLYMYCRNNPLSYIDPTGMVDCRTNEDAQNRKYYGDLPDNRDISSSHKKVVIINSSDKLELTYNLIKDAVDLIVPNYVPQSTKQIGVSVSVNIGPISGTYGAGFVGGVSKRNGLQFGFYTVKGFGGGLGLGISLMGDITHSSNDDIHKLSGKAGTVGGSFGEVVVAGGEINIPINNQNKKIKSSYTSSVGFGLYAPLPIPFEEHGMVTNTSIYD